MAYEHWAFCLTALIYLVEANRISRNQLSSSILHYEPVDYSRRDLITKHHIIRKSLGQNYVRRVLELNFKAHKRQFNLRLKRDLSLFADNLHIERATDFHPRNIYEGYLLNEPQSLVHGFIYDGIFEGRIHTEDGSEFHIESAKQYKHLRNESIHSVIYNVKDIAYKDPHQCGGISAKTKYTTFNKNTTISNIDGNKITFKPEVHIRQRREIDAKKKTECHLYVRADPTYTMYAGGEDRAMHLMTQHVKRVSAIFRITDFNNDNIRDQYTLNIQKIGVIDTSICKNRSFEKVCRYVSTNIGVEKFLDIVSLEDHDKFCLSYVFTHRDFSEGVLGLAWIGDVDGAGGICDPYQSIGGSMKSLNTGIVSTLNYGKPVPSMVTDITLAHELGHNFGSQHDPLKSECAPGGTGGNYIMYPRATSGSAVNNNKFSTCSKDAIYKVLQAKAHLCFKVQGEPICGNRIVEKGEQCDCGYEDERNCLNDECCNGASKNGDSSGCKYTSKAIKVGALKCSPSQGEGDCCNPQTCSPYLNSTRQQCFKRTECADESFCFDNSPKCPKPKARDNLCNSGANTCVRGQCIGSLCLKLGKEDCQCPKSADLCKICCQEKHSKGVSNCSIYLRNETSEPQLRPPGSPCNQYQGYCDILNKCRKVDAEGPLSRLKKWLLNPKSFSTILDWMKSHWWACVLMGLGLVLFMAGFIACCSVHTPSSNPAQPQHRTLRQTLSRRRSHNRPSAPALSLTGRNPPEHPPGYHTAVCESRILPDYEMNMR